MGVDLIEYFHGIAELEKGKALVFSRKGIQKTVGICCRVMETDSLVWKSKHVIDL